MYFPIDPDLFAFSQIGKPILDMEKTKTLGKISIIWGHAPKYMIGQGEKSQCQWLNRAHERSFHPDLQDKILFYLSDVKTAASRERHLQLNTSDKELSIFGKDLIIGERIQALRFI